MRFGWFLIPALPLACAAQRVPCAGADACSKGRECLASRCVEEGGEPVPPGSRRTLLWPIALAVASNESDTGGLAASVTLGRAKGANTALYVRFDSAWRDRGQVLSGFLLFEPQAGVKTSDDVPLEVWRARSEFASERLKWAAQPGFAPPFAKGLARVAPPAPVRIDVTELLRFFAEHPTQDHGFLVRAAVSGENGVTLTTGTDGGLPPRLDVYLSE